MRALFDTNYFGVVDTIVPEPLGGAHRDRAKAVTTLGDALAKALAELDGIAPDELRRLRREKFLAMGQL